MLNNSCFDSSFIISICTLYNLQINNLAYYNRSFHLFSPIVKYFSFIVRVKLFCFFDVPAIQLVLEFLGSTSPMYLVLFTLTFPLWLPIFVSYFCFENDYSDEEAISVLTTLWMAGCQENYLRCESKIRTSKGQV